MIEALKLIIEKDERALEKKKKACETLSDAILKDDLTFAEAFNALLHARKYGIVSEDLFKYVFDKYKLPVPEIDQACLIAALKYDGFEVIVPLSEVGEDISIIPDSSPSTDMVLNRNDQANSRTVSMASNHIETLKAVYIGRHVSPWEVLKERTYRNAAEAAVRFIRILAEECGDVCSVKEPSVFTMMFEGSRMKYIDGLTSVLNAYVNKYNQDIKQTVDRIAKARAEYKRILPDIEDVIRTFDGAFFHKPADCRGLLNEVELVRKIANSSDCN